MGRHHPKYYLPALFKDSVFATLRSLTQASPSFRRAVHFYPEFKVPAQIEWLERRVLNSQMTSERYSDALKALEIANVDKIAPAETFEEPYRALRAIGLVTDSRVSGHTFRIINNADATAVSLTSTGVLNWNWAHPTVARVLRRKGTVIPVPFYRNYYHFLADSILPVSYALSRYADQLPKPITLAVGSIDNPAYRSAVDILRSIATVDVVELNRFTHLDGEVVLGIGGHARNRDNNFCFSEIVPEFRDRILRYFGLQPPPVSSRPLYLRRGKTKLRTVEGEAELCIKLETLGYDIFEPQWTNWPEQVLRCMAASVLVAPHGAAMANVLWMEPGSHCVEITPNNARKTVYLHLAAMRDLGFGVIVAGDEREAQRFSINPDEMRDAIEESVNNRSTVIDVHRNQAFLSDPNPSISLPKPSVCSHRSS